MDRGRKMLEVITYSRKQFSDTIHCNDINVGTFTNDYFICINSSGGIHSEPYFNKDHNNVFNTYFDDVVEDGKKYYGPTDSEYEYNARAMTVSQAKELHKFIHNIPDNSRIHIYCTKGKSRSVAVRKYIDEFINNTPYNDDGYNILVYELLKCLSSK